MTERELLADCLRRLNGLGLPCMLTGSMASNFWGVPGTTHDLDFVLSFLHKLYWNSITPSERQLGDAAGIVAVQGAELDRNHLEHWARELGVTTVLRDLHEGKIRPKST